MSNPNLPDERLAELRALLETYGASRSRWPAADRLAMAAFIAADRQAQTLVQEAEALDRLLDLAPVVSIERERALAQRIVAAALAPQMQKGPEVNPVVQFRPKAQSALPQWRGRARHAAGALLAASLVLGIFAGSTGHLSSAFDALAEAAGLSDDEAELAFISDASSSGEESL